MVILVLTLVLARLLTPEDFGLVTAALTLIAMLDAALDLGVGAAVVAEQEHGITPAGRGPPGTLNLIMSDRRGGAGIAASPLIAALFDAPDQAWLFALIFLYPLFRGAGQVSDAVLKRDLLFKRRNRVDLLRAAVRVAVSIPLALTVGGAISIAAGIVVSELAAMVLLMVLEPVRPVLRIDRATVRSLLGFGGQVTVDPRARVGAQQRRLPGRRRGARRVGPRHLRDGLQAPRDGHRERAVDLLRRWPWRPTPGRTRTGGRR